MAILTEEPANRAKWAHRFFDSYGDKVHKTIYNVVHLDGHISVYKDPNGTIASQNIGNTGYALLETVWRSMDEN